MIQIKLTELQSSIKEALACFEGFRRLGFKSDDIYIMFSDGFLYSCLRVQNKEFNVDLGELNLNQEDFQEYWNQIVERYNSGPEEEVSKIWEDSFFKKNFNSAVVLIKKKGIFIPVLTN